MNVWAQKAASASCGGRDYDLGTRELVRQWKAFLAKELEFLGLPCLDGEGNFVTIKLPINGLFDYLRLTKQGVMIRTTTGFRFQDWIRVIIHAVDEMELLIESLANECNAQIDVFISVCQAWGDTPHEGISQAGESPLDPHARP
mgnify:CR=1 FL=1